MGALGVYKVVWEEAFLPLPLGITLLTPALTNSRLLAKTP